MTKGCAFKKADRVVSTQPAERGETSCPDDKLGGVGEEATGDVGGRIGLLPRDHVQNLVAQLGQTVGHGEDVVVSAADPNTAVVLELVATQAQPLPIERPHVLLRLPLVPRSLVHTHHLAALQRDAAIGEKIGWVGEDHVKLEVKRP